MSCPVLSCPVHGYVEQLKQYLSLLLLTTTPPQFISSIWLLSQTFFLFRSASFDLECVNSHLEFPPHPVSIQEILLLFHVGFFHSLCHLKFKSKTLLLQVKPRHSGWDYVPTAAMLLGGIRGGQIPHKNSKIGFSKFHQKIVVMLVLGTPKHLELGLKLQN